MVFVPVTRDQAHTLRSGPALGRCPGCAATPALRTALGADTAPEEAEFVALGNAGVLGLDVGADPLRLVLAVDVGAGQVEDGQLQDGGDQHGEVTVSGVGWAQVLALFGDEPAAAPLVARARAAAGGRSLADSLRQAEVDALLDGFDLLWYATEELDALP